MMVSIIRVPLLAISKITSDVSGRVSFLNNLSRAHAYNLTESYKYAADIDTNWKSLFCFFSKNVSPQTRWLPSQSDGIPAAS